jgi:hypothetical protein
VTFQIDVTVRVYCVADDHDALDKALYSLEHCDLPHVSVVSSEGWRAWSIEGHAEVVAGGEVQP